MKPLPGFLTRPELEQLTEPVDHFEVFRRDVMTFRYARELVTTSTDAAVYKSFSYCNSMGSGGGLLFGNTDYQVCIARLAGLRLPHCLLLRKTWASRLRCLFRGGRLRNAGRPGLRQRYLLYAEDAREVTRQLEGELGDYLASARPAFSLEWGGEWLVVHRFGRCDRGLLAGLIEEVEPLVPYLSHSA